MRHDLQQNGRCNGKGQIRIGKAQSADHVAWRKMVLQHAQDVRTRCVYLVSAPRTDGLGKVQCQAERLVTSFSEQCSSGQELIFINGHTFMKLVLY